MTYQKLRDRIRRQRRTIRHLKSLLKSKDRLLFAQETFYKCLLEEAQKQKKQA